MTPTPIADSVRDSREQLRALRPYQESGDKRNQENVRIQFVVRCENCQVIKRYGETREHNHGEQEKPR